jgi:hypothetical protein
MLQVQFKNNWQMIGISIFVRPIVNIGKLLTALLERLDAEKLTAGFPDPIAIGFKKLIEAFT